MDRQPRRPSGPPPVLVAAAAPALVLLRHGDESPSTLDPVGPQADAVATAWWILFGVAAFMCVLVTVLVVLAVMVRRRARTVHQGEAKGFVLTFGVAMPAVVLGATFVLSVFLIQRTDSPSTRPDTSIDVIGHQWWWEVRYGDTAVTANEIHVPVGDPVELRLSSADVIHSFWVPQVMPKTDLIPGRVNHTWLKADKVGVYRGECAEYCGLQHTHMAFQVVVEPEADYRRWLQTQQEEAQTPAADLEARGLEVLTSTSCATCHTVRGTTADGDVGPDLTHVGSRLRLGAGAIPNDTGHMAGWVANSQTIKPGNKMPPQQLSPADLRAVVAYLQGLE